MIEARAKQQIEETAPSAMLTLVLRWTGAPDLEPIRRLETRHQRATAAREAYRLLKHDIMQRLVEVGGALVTDLPGTANAIVTAHPSTWREIQPLLEARYDIRIVPNETVERASADQSTGA